MLIYKSKQIFKFYSLKVTVCEADSMTNTDSGATICYESHGSESCESKTDERNYYSHSEPEFVKDISSESDMENQCQHSRTEL